MAAAMDIISARAFAQHNENVFGARQSRVQANTAVKFFRKAFTSSSGAAAIGGVNLTDTGTFKMPCWEPHGKGQSGEFNWDKVTEVSWKAFVAIGHAQELEGWFARDSGVSGYIVEVTIEPMRLRELRHFMSGSIQAETWAWNSYMEDGRCITISPEFSGSKTKAKVRLAGDW